MGVLSVAHRISFSCITAVKVYVVARLSWYLPLTKTQDKQLTFALCLHKKKETLDHIL